jgi:membrane protein
MVSSSERAAPARRHKASEELTSWQTGLKIFLLIVGLAMRGDSPPRSQTSAQPSRRPLAGAEKAAGREAARSAERDPRVQAEPTNAEDRRRARQEGRGRKAQQPTEIPAKGWKDILWRVYAEISQDRLIAVAAGVTFYTLLAIFPAIAAFVSVYGLFADPGTVSGHIAELGGLLPGGAMDIITEQVTRIASQDNRTLGLALAISLGLSIWSANAGIKAMMDALNVVYDEEEKRGFFKLNLISLSFTLGAIVLLLLALGSTVVVPIVLSYVGLGSMTEMLIRILRWPALLVLVVGGLSVLYRYGPSRTEAKWRWVTPGGIFAGIAWIAGSMLFSWYVASFGNYNETYGSLGAVIGLMTWIWLSSIVILVGGEINAETEHQTAKDTTRGQEKPLGRRGATMADKVGAAQV